MKQVYEKKWSHVLFQDEESEVFCLSVVCGSVGLYTIDITLNEQEMEMYRKKGNEYINTLAQSVAADPSKYQPRHVRR